MSSLSALELFTDGARELREETCRKKYLVPTR